MCTNWREKMRIFCTDVECSVGTDTMNTEKNVLPLFPRANGIRSHFGEGNWVGNRK